MIGLVLICSCNILVIILAIIKAKYRHSYIEELKSEYCNSLKENNKEKALNAGRAYYRALKGSQYSMRLIMSPTHNLPLSQEEDLKVQNEVDEIMK
jgi:hypothetical protein